MQIKDKQKYKLKIATGSLLDDFKNFGFQLHAGGVETT